jgi:hypothetical protein
VSTSRRRRAHYLCFGVPITIDAPPTFSAARLRNVLPPGTRAGRSTGEARTYQIERTAGRHALLVDGALLAGELSAPELLDLLEGDVALHVAAVAPGHVFIHAGVVSHRGRALLLPGRTLSGKSTLVASLVDQGATYYSDEYAVLDARGRVWPYPRPMSLRRTDAAPRRVLPRRRGGPPVRIGWVYGLAYAPGGALQLQRLSGGRTALLLMANAVAARHAPARVLPALRAAVDGAVGFVGERGNAAPAAASILADCL